MRYQRLRAAPAQVRQVEQSLERIEGSANLVGHASAAAALGAGTGAATTAVREYLTLALDRFGGDRAAQLMRWRAYGTGAALGLLLDRSGIPWRGPLARGTSFDTLLEQATSFDPTRAASLARAALDEYGYDEVLDDAAVTTSPDDELDAFLDLAPVRLVIDVQPRDTATYDLRISHSFSSGLVNRLLRRRQGMSQPEPGLTLLWRPDLVHTGDPASAGFTLHVEHQPVALDGRAGRALRRFVVLLPVLPSITGEVTRDQNVYGSGVVIEGAGVRFETSLRTEVVIASADSVHVLITP